MPSGSWLLYPLRPSPMPWGRRAWLQIAGCMPWCFLLSSVWSNVAFSVSTNSLLLTWMRHEKEICMYVYMYVCMADASIPLTMTGEQCQQPTTAPTKNWQDVVNSRPANLRMLQRGWPNVSLYQARLQGATNSSTVTILYIARYCWRAGPCPTRYWCCQITHGLKINI